MKLHVVAVLTAAMLLLGAAAGQEKGDQDQIQGEWTIVSLESGGKKPPEEFLKEMRMIITKDQMIFAKGDKKKEPVTFKLDPGKKPKWINLTAKEAGMEIMFPGIYELKGDELKICFTAEKEKAERPKEFTSAEGSRHVLFVLKREKK
jgi:uncharacterized protein (TIGR03067 family)